VQACNGNAQVPAPQVTEPLGGDVNVLEETVDNVMSMGDPGAIDTGIVKLGP